MHEYTLKNSFCKKAFFLIFNAYVTYLKKKLNKYGKKYFFLIRKYLSDEKLGVSLSLTIFYSFPYVFDCIWYIIFLYLYITYYISRWHPIKKMLLFMYIYCTSVHLQKKKHICNAFFICTNKKHELQNTHGKSNNMKTNL